MSALRRKDEFEEKILKRVAMALWGIIFLVLIGALMVLPYVGTFREAIFEATGLMTQIYITHPEVGGSLFLVAFFGKVLVIYIIYIIILLFNEGMFRDAIKEAIVMRRIKKYKNHIIIAGGGRVGSSVAMALKQRKQQFVIIEKNPEAVLEFSEHHENVIEGDALDEILLEKVGIRQARVFVSTLGNDGDNIMQIILAKRLNPHIKVVARANYPNFIDNLRKFGADEVIMPEVIGGEKIAHTALMLK